MSRRNIRSTPLENKHTRKKHPQLTPTPVGLQNDGLTCHFLAVLQVLAASSVFVSRIEKHNRSELKNAIAYVVRRGSDSTSVKQLMRHLDIQSHVPGDAAESFRRIIEFANGDRNSAHVSENTQNNTLSIDRGVDALIPGHSKIADHVFWRRLSTRAIKKKKLHDAYDICGSGTFGMYLVCAVDKTTTVEYEDAISLPRHGSTLETCLDAYFDIERVEDTNKTIIRKLFILPRVLAIHIVTPYHSSDQILEYSHSMNIAPYCAVHTSQPLYYNLVGVVCYVDHKLGIGHFYARVRRGRKWFFVNDEKVQVDESRGINDKHAILLLYEKSV